MERNTKKEEKKDADNELIEIAAKLLLLKIKSDLRKENQ